MVPDAAIRNGGAVMIKRSIAAAMLFFTVVPVPTAAASNCYSISTRERAVVRRINELRRSNGMRTLDTDRQLAYVARYHSREMARAGRTYHTGTDDIARGVPRVGTLGR